MMTDKPSNNRKNLPTKSSTPRLPPNLLIKNNNNLLTKRSAPPTSSKPSNKKKNLTKRSTPDFLQFKPNKKGEKKYIIKRSTSWTSSKPSNKKKNLLIKSSTPRLPPKPSKDNHESPAAKYPGHTIARVCRKHGGTSNAIIRRERQRQRSPRNSTPQFDCKQTQPSISCRE